VLEGKTSSPSPVLSFGVFQVNIAARELRKHGVRIRLPGQPFCILAILLERPGEVVTRDEMRQRLWASDTFVDFEHSLNTAIKKLRRALGDSPDNPRYVETVPRIGYRFIAPLNTVRPKPDDPVGRPLANNDLVVTAAPAALRTTARNRRTRQALWLVLFVAAVAGATLVFNRFFLATKHPAVKEKDLVVLADFENTTGERIFDDTLKQGLAVGLEQSRYIQVLSERKSAVILKQMGRSPDERLSGQTAIELCQRAGSHVMVQGSISSLGTIYLIGLTAIRCDNSEAIAHEQIEARRKEDIIAALGTSATRLRNRLGETMTSIQKHSAPLEQVTTTSLEALKAYGMAVSVFDREGERVAIPLFSRAIELDPGFAMAYGQLATIYQNLGETQLARENEIKAFEHKERLTESERIVIESWYNVYVTGDLEKAVQLYEMELQEFPVTATVLNDLGATYGILGHYEKASTAFRESLQLDPSGASTYGNAAVSMLALGREKDADGILAEADNHRLQTDYLLQVRYWKAFLQGHSSDMEALLSQSANVPGARPVLIAEQARTEAYFGRFQKSRQLSELAANMMERQGDKESAANCLAELGLREAEIGSDARAQTYILRARQLSRGPEVATLEALALARMGQLRQADIIAEEVNNQHPLDTLMQKYWLPTIRAQIELHQGNASKALAALTVAVPFDFAAPPPLTMSTMYPAYVRGQAYLAAGDGKHATSEFDKLLEHPGMILNFPILAFAQLGRARTLARLGDLAGAQDSYQKFFQLWKAADRNLPVMREAHIEFAALKSGPEVRAIQ
jgi:DNA-binding winged helix-turn-helix (wHTH) protein/Flp pilus assembly protein TadD